MEIHIRYKDGHLDLFDTTTFTKSEPFIGTNMLTEFVVETDGIEESGLWLSVHSYDTSQQEADAAAEPVAFRKRGWKFLLAEAGEVDEIESVTVGGTMLLHRVLGELVCIEILNDSAAIWLGNPHGYSISQRIVALFDAIRGWMSVEGADCEEIARKCGCSYSLITKLQALTMIEQPLDDDESDNAEENWMEGLIDEDID